MTPVIVRTYEFPSNWHGYKINQPFEFSFQLPEPDLGKKGYSPAFAEKLENELIVVK